MAFIFTTLIFVTLFFCFISCAFDFHFCDLEGVLYEQED